MTPQVHRGHAVGGAEMLDLWYKRGEIAPDVVDHDEGRGPLASIYEAERSLLE